MKYFFGFVAEGHFVGFNCLPIGLSALRRFLLEDWIIGDLSFMENGIGPVYERALAVGILVSDEIARRFANKLRLYKPKYRRTEAEAALLQGGFIGE